MTVALYAAVCLAVLCAGFCALTAVFLSRASQLETNLRSMTSMQGELTEIRDYMIKLDRWAKRINARDHMDKNRDPETGLRKASSNGAFSDSPKDELRRRAGLIAGQAARHHGE